MRLTTGWFVTLMALAGCGQAPETTQDSRPPVDASSGAEAAPGTTPRLYRIPGDFATPAEGVAAASDGDTLVLAPGTHPAVSLEGKGLVLASEALLTGDTTVIRTTVLDGGGGDWALFLPETEAMTEIHGLTLQNADDCIYPNAHFRLIRSVIRECTDGVDYERGSGGLISNSVFENNRDDGIDLDEDVAVVIEASVIRNNGQDGIEIRLMPWEGDVREVIIKDNHIHGNGEDGIQFIDYDGLSNRRYRVEGNRIQGNLMAGIGCMDNQDTNEDYRAASIPEPIVLVENNISGNGRDLSCGALGSGSPNGNPQQADKRLQ